MRAVGHKGGKERDDVKEDIGDAFDDSVRLLTLIECVTQAGVDCDNVVNVPKHLLDKVGATFFGDDVRRVERGYPNLCMRWLACTVRIKTQAYITQVLHVAYKVTLGIDDFVDCLLPPLLLIRDAVYDLFGHRMYPKHAWFNMVHIAQALTAELALNAKAW